MSKNTQQEIATPQVRNYKIANQLSSTRRITYTAVFVAIALTMKYVGQFLTLTPSFVLTLIYVPWILSGAVLGVGGAAAVGLISDLLGALTFPTGAWNPIITLGNTLYPVIAALVFKFLPVRSNIIKVIVGGILGLFICSMGINSAAIYYMYGQYKVVSFWQFFAVSRWSQPIVGAVNIVIAAALVPLCERLKLIKPKPRLVAVKPLIPVEVKK